MLPNSVRIVVIDIPHVSRAYRYIEGRLHWRESPDHRHPSDGYRRRVYGDYVRRGVVGLREATAAATAEKRRPAQALASLPSTLPQPSLSPVPGRQAIHIRTRQPPQCIDGEFHFIVENRPKIEEELVVADVAHDRRIVRAKLP